MLCLISTLLFQFKQANASAEFDDRLSFLAPYLGTWQAVFQTKNGTPSVVDVSLWERALNGKAVRTLHSINDGDYGGESLIFWDKKRQKLVFYYFTTADFFTTGEIELLSENSFAAYEKVSGNEDGITKVRSVSTLAENKMTVSTAYFKGGSWSEPEERVYSRSDKKVIFR